MSNTIKFNVSTETLAVKKGDFWIGTGDVGKGPTSETDYWNGITPPPCGYTIYLNKGSNGPSIYIGSTDNLMVDYTNKIVGSSFTTANECLVYYAGQTGMMSFNRDCPLMVTNGLIFNMDAAFTPSYPNSGTTWYNLSYSGSNGTLVNGTTYSSSFGGVFNFDGINDHVTVNNFMGNITEFSVSHFIYLNATQNTKTIFSNFGASNNGWSTGIRDGVNNVFKFYLGNGNNLHSNTTLLNQTWYHVTVTYSNGDPKIYINGELDASSSNTITFASSYLGNDIGRLGNASQYFNGKIAQVSTYNRALTPSEVLQNYNGGIARFDTTNTIKNGLTLNLNSLNVVSYPTTGTTWLDISGNANTGTLVGGPTFDSPSRSIVFDGINDYVTFPTITNDIYTLDFLYKIGSNDGSLGFIASSGNNGLAISEGSTISGLTYGQFYYWNGSNIITLGTLQSTTTWSKVTAVINTSTNNIKLYINGVILSNTTVTNLSKSISNIGRNLSSNNNFLKGNISTFMVYQQELTPTEIFQNYYMSPMSTNGLVMYVDAANLVSYPGSGTPWRNLTGGVSGTLTNGPTFNSSDGGSVVLDGVNDYVGFGNIFNNVIAGPNKKFTVTCGFYPTRTSGSQFLIGKYSDSATSENGREFAVIVRDLGTGFKVDVAFSTNLFNFVNVVRSNDTLTVNQPNIITVTYDDDYPTSLEKVNIYINGKLSGKTLPFVGDFGPIAVGPAQFAIGASVSSNGLSANRFVGRVYYALLYNKLLTVSEILQDFNCFKTRYGL